MRLLKKPGSVTPATCLIPCMNHYTSANLTPDGVTLGAVGGLVHYQSRPLIGSDAVVVTDRGSFLDEYMEYLWSVGMGSPLVIAVPSVENGDLFDAIAADQDAKQYLCDFDGYINAFVSSQSSWDGMVKKIGINPKKIWMVPLRYMTVDHKINARIVFPDLFKPYQKALNSRMIFDGWNKLNDQGYESLVIRRGDLDGGVGMMMVVGPPNPNDTAVINYISKFVGKGAELLIEPALDTTNEISIHMDIASGYWFVTKQHVRNCTHLGNTIPTQANFEQVLPEHWPVKLRRRVIHNAVAKCEIIRKWFRQYRVATGRFSVDGTILENEEYEFFGFEINLRDTNSTPPEQALRMLDVKEAAVSTHVQQVAHGSDISSLRGLLQNLNFDPKTKRGVLIGTPYALFGEKPKVMLVSFGTSATDSQGLIEQASNLLNT